MARFAIELAVSVSQFKQSVPTFSFNIRVLALYLFRALFHADGFGQGYACIHDDVVVANSKVFS